MERSCRPVPVDVEGTWGWCPSTHQRFYTPWRVILQPSDLICVTGHQAPEGVHNLDLYPIILLYSLSLI